MLNLDAPFTPADGALPDERRRWLWAGAALAAAGVSGAQAAVEWGAGPEADGFTLAEGLEVLTALLQIPVLVGLLEAAKRFESPGLRRSSIGLFGSLWAATAVGLIESDERPPVWEIVLLLLAVGGTAGFLAEVIKRPWTPVLPVAPGGTDPAESTTAPMPLDYARPGKKKSVAAEAGICGAVFVGYLLFKGLVRKYPVLWLGLVAAFMALLVILAASFGVWSGVVKLRLRKRAGPAALVAGGLDLAVVVVGATALGYGAAAVARDPEGDWPAAALRGPLLAVGIATLAWHLATASFLIAAARHGRLAAR